MSDDRSPGGPEPLPDREGTGPPRASHAPAIDASPPQSAREYAADLYPARAGSRVGRGPRPVLILAVFALCVLALFGGELLGSMIRGDAGPTDAQSSASDEPDPSQPGVADGANTDGTSIIAPARRTFSDGFTLLTQPCATEPTGPDCGASGSVNSGTVWVLLSFQNGEPADRLAVTVVAGGDDPVGGGELELSELGCEPPCGGWTYFQLSDLPPGNYRINVSRNGEPGGSTPFGVEPPVEE